ncbi:MAG: hypothetical protein KKE20_07195 [Nanoarchaeota archaeon]|nr:hypothetical protein [Nanoarchaeota archaeon]
MKNPIQPYMVFAGVTILILVSVVLYAGIYIYSLTKIEYTGMENITFSDISMTGMTMNSQLKLYNGGLVRAKIDNITYDINLESTGERIAEGFIDGKTILAGQAEVFPASSRIHWAPSADAALSLLTQEATYILINGTVHVSELEFTEIGIHFEKQVDIEPYLAQFISAKLNQTTLDLVGSLIDALI